MTRNYNLPDGSVTISDSLYTSSWQDLAEPIERRMGWWECSAFDPSLSFRRGGCRGGDVDAEEGT